MSLSDSKFAWKNGKIVPWAEATVHISCHGLHYGTGVFEGIRCYDSSSGPVVFRLSTHIDRWFASAQVYGISWQYTRQELIQAVLDVIHANRFRDCYIRPIAFYGSHTLAILPQGCPLEVAILAWPASCDVRRDYQASGIDVCLSPWRKFSSSAIPTRAKATGQILNSVLAVQDAAARGFRATILFDDEGNLTEGSEENLFIVRRNRLLTNDQDSAIFLGVTRDSILRIANDLGIDVLVQKLRSHDLLQADEAFLTSTIAEIMPIATVDLHRIGAGTSGPITTKLQQAYLKAASGQTSRYLSWLTYVTLH
jgi:branched-chain amino acid aminotransferase